MSVLGLNIAGRWAPRPAELSSLLQNTKSVRSAWSVWGQPGTVPATPRNETPAEGSSFSALLIRNWHKMSSVEDIDPDTATDDERIFRILRVPEERWKTKWRLNRLRYKVIRLGRELEMAARKLQEENEKFIALAMAGTGSPGLGSPPGSPSV